MSKKSFLTVCLIIMLISCSDTSKIRWMKSTPEEQGMNSRVLIDAIENFSLKKTNIHSLLIIRNNRIVLDTYFYPFQKGFVHDMASVTKSVTSLLIGIAIDKGFIKDENQPVTDFFPEYKIRNDTLKTMTIKELLNMSSGLACSWNEGEKELNQMMHSADWVGFMFSLPFETKPGEKFSYCSGNYYLLAEILQRTTKMKCHDFARKHLFEPLDFGTSFWQENSKGVNHGWGDLHISPYDMAKIGCLILNEGIWEGKQIISSKWLNKIKPSYHIQGTESYGYGWWLDSENPDEIQAVGRGGQRLFIFREKNLVIAATGGGFDAGDIDNYVLGSISSYDKNRDQSSELQKLSDKIQSPEKAELNPAGNEFPADYLDKTYHFGQNRLEINTLRFRLLNSEYYLVVSHGKDRVTEEYPFGLNGQYIFSKERTFGLPIALKSNWINKSTLLIDYNELCRIQDYKFRIGFNNDSINLNITESSMGINETLTGKVH